MVSLLLFEVYYILFNYVREADGQKNHTLENHGQDNYQTTLDSIAVSVFYFILIEFDNFRERTLAE